MVDFSDRGMWACLCVLCLFGSSDCFQCVFATATLWILTDLVVTMGMRSKGIIWHLQVGRIVSESGVIFHWKLMMDLSMAEGLLRCVDLNAE